MIILFIRPDHVTRNPTNGSAVLLSSVSVCITWPDFSAIGGSSGQSSKTSANIHVLIEARRMWSFWPKLLYPDPELLSTLNRKTFREEKRVWSSDPGTLRPTRIILLLPTRIVLLLSTRIILLLPTWIILLLPTRIILLHPTRIILLELSYSFLLKLNYSVLLELSYSFLLELSYSFLLELSYSFLLRIKLLLLKIILLHPARILLTPSY